MKNKTMEEKIRKIITSPIISQLQTGDMMVVLSTTGLNEKARDLTKLFEEQIHLSNESLVQRVRKEIINLNYESESKSSEYDCSQEGYEYGVSDALFVPSLSTPKPKGDE